MGDDRKGGVNVSSTGLGLARSLGLASIPLLIVVILVLAIASPSGTFEPSYLLPALNTIFLSIIPFTVAYFCWRGYLATGNSMLLFIGCSMLAFGTGSIIAGFLIDLPGGRNLTPTIHNTGALMSGLFITIAGLLSLQNRPLTKNPRHSLFKIGLAYFTILLFMALFTIASLIGLTPPFFIQGAGPTALRQVILGAATILFAVSSITFLRSYLKWTGFSYWFSLGLAAITLGLIAVFLQKEVGGAMGWAGRAAQYAGCIYILIGILAAARMSYNRHTALASEIAGSFSYIEANYKTLVEIATDAIVSTDNENRVLTWNPAASRIFGYAKQDAVGSLLADLIIPDESEDAFKKSIEASLNKKDGGEQQEKIELTARNKNGKKLPVEISLASRKVSPRSGSASITIMVIRDTTERKNMEDALRESEAEANALIKHAPTAIYEIDLSGTGFRSFNDAVCNMTGYSREELAAMAPASLLDDDSKKLFAERIRQELTGEKTDPTVEYKVRKKDGSIIFATLNTSFSQHKPDTALVIGHDVTERRKWELELLKRHHELEEMSLRLKALFDYSSASLALFDAQKPYTVLAHNKYYQGLWGEPFRTYGMIGKNLLDYVPQVETGGVMAIFDEVVETKQAKNLLRFPYDGMERGRTWWNWHLSPIIREDKVVALAHLAVDVTNEVTAIQSAEKISETLLSEINERQKAEEELRFANSKLEFAQDAANAGIWDWDIPSGKLTWSKAFFRLFGLPPSSQASFATWLGELHKDDREPAMAKINSSIEQHTPLDNEYRIIWPDGQERWINAVGNTEYDANGTPLRMSGICIDITERKKIERLKEDFIGMISHEMRTPLTVIIGAIDTSLTPGISKALSRELLQDAVSGAQELSSILENLLELSRFQANRLNIKKSPVNIAQLTQKCIDRAGAARSGHKVVIDIEAGIPLFVADPVRLETVLHNLIENAIKYSPPDREIRIIARQQNNAIMMGVKDQGKGISQEQQDRLFQRFERLEEDAARSKGLGLGLVVCKHLVEAHGGRIWVESSPGNGSTFQFTIPL
jgi:PAS domain S-box-containing protein